MTISSCASLLCYRKPAAGRDGLLDAAEAAPSPRQPDGNALSDEDDSALSDTFFQVRSCLPCSNQASSLKATSSR